MRDPLGNIWWVQQRAAELTGEEIAERASRPELVEAMRYVQSSLVNQQVQAAHPGMTRH